MSSLEAKIHQGRYDTEKELLNLRVNAIARDRLDIIDAVNQRLKKKHSKIYQRLVGPLRDRKRDPKFKCYCNNPKSLSSICQDIINNSVHPHCLTCDDCWQDDLCVTWGYYGFSSKVIDKAEWNLLCDERAQYKFVE
ncbi:hypothetical protein [Lysobacter sp. A289]